MDAFTKLASLKEHTTFECAEDADLNPGSGAARKKSALPPAQSEELPIYLAALPNGRRMPLLKSVLTSACERNCYYCGMRAGLDCRRVTFKPDELANAFHRMYQCGAVQGIFLSSGVAGGGVRTQDRLLDAAEILRLRLGYKGYLHLKIMPGAEKAQVERAMQLADRVSVNLEAPTTQSLQRLAPQKQFLAELMQPLTWIEEIRRSQPPWQGWSGRWPSSSTQFVVGAAGESDLELLQTAAFLHSQLHLMRVYFSGFQPVHGTPLENLPPLNPWREHRLYQASFLLRDYDFSFEELPYDLSGSLPLEIDPKLAWAREHLGCQPLEVNRADLKELLRIPGIGPHGARAILAARRATRLRRLEDLKAAGVRNAARAAPFILLDGRQPPVQLSLWG